MKVLVFTVATNGYARLYADCIRSQRVYAKKYGYDYVAVTDPKFIMHYSARDSAWLKIPLLLAAFARGYDLVTFIDADCQIMERCPEVTTLVTPGSSIYVAHGFSKRINSGFIVALNNERSKAFFSDLLARAYTYEVPAEDNAPYENGYFINQGKDSKDISIIGNSWNNNQVPKPTDYVRHYTGPMRALATLSGLSQVWVGTISRLSALYGLIIPARPFHERIQMHFRESIKVNSSFFLDYGISKDLSRNKEHAGRY